MDRTIGQSAPLGLVIAGDEKGDANETGYESSLATLALSPEP